MLVSALIPSDAFLAPINQEQSSLCPPFPTLGNDIASVTTERVKGIYMIQSPFLLTALHIENGSIMWQRPLLWNDGRPAVLDSPQLKASDGIIFLAGRDKWA